MPREWYDKNANRSAYSTDKETYQFNSNIIADRKPYFMRYIYPTLMRQYNTYIANTNRKALREFRITIDELLNLSYDKLTKEQKVFIQYYYSMMPVGIHDCVMNRICRRFEEEFDGYIVRNKPDDDFDYTIMKSDQCTEYSQAQYNGIYKLYTAYNKRICDYMQYVKSERIDESESRNCRGIMLSDFARDCVCICSNRYQLCNILLDICYQKEGTKQFVWDVAGDVIIENLLSKNNYEIAYPVRDDSGDTYYEGDRFLFTAHTIEEVSDEYCTE